MEFSIDNRHPMRATRSNPTTALSDFECMLHWATVDVDAYTPSFESALPRPAVTPNMEMAPSYMKRVMAVHIGTEAKEDTAGTVDENDSDNTY